MLANPWESTSPHFQPDTSPLLDSSTQAKDYKATLDLPEEIKQALVHPEYAQIKVLDLGYQVIPPPENIIDNFPEELQEYLQICLPILIRYVEKILFTDTFTEHKKGLGPQTSRRDWKELQTNAEIWKLLKNNRINLNNISRVTTALSILNVKLQNSKDLFVKNIANLINENSKDLVKELIGYADPMTEIKIPVKEIAEKLGIPINELDQSKLLEKLAEYHYFPDSEGMVTRKEEMENPTTGYDTLTPDQKLDVVKRTTQLCIQILNLFGYEVLKVT